MSTNTKEISKKVQEHIFHSFDSYDDMMDNLKYCQKKFAAKGQYDVGGQMVDTASFLIYHDDIRKFLKGITGESPAVQVKKYSPDQTMTFYKNLINKEIPNIIAEGGRSYIKPENPLEQAKKAGLVQGVCECAAIVSEDKSMANKLLTEMKVTKSMAKEYAKPETYKELEKTVFAPKIEQKLEQEQKHTRGRHR